MVKKLLLVFTTSIKTPSNTTERFGFLLTCHWPGDKSACSHIRRRAGPPHPSRTRSSAGFLKANWEREESEKHPENNWPCISKWKATNTRFLYKRHTAPSSSIISRLIRSAYYNSYDLNQCRDPRVQTANSLGIFNQVFTLKMEMKDRGRILGYRQTSDITAGGFGSRPTTIERVTGIFWFPGAYKSYAYTTL